MKKTTLILALILLAGCSNVEALADEGVQPDLNIQPLSPVTISGFEISVEATLNYQQGEFDLGVKELLELLPDLTQELPPHELNAFLEPVEIAVEAPIGIEPASYEYMCRLLGVQWYQRWNCPDYFHPVPLPETTHLQISYPWEDFSFGPMTFTKAGNFLYRISLTFPGDNWQISEPYFYVMVTVTENFQTEALEATISLESTFETNVSYQLAIEEIIEEAKESLWQTRVTKAYEAGYNLTRDEHGTETKEAIPEPEEEYVSEYYNTPDPPSSSIPEDHAQWLSHDEALSYLALVNRHFRLSSSFTPGDLSTVNVSSRNGTHRMRYTAARHAEQLFHAAYGEGGHILLALSGYRSYATQRSTHNHWISVHGETEARRLSARAGHSEHQLGLALDITTPALGRLSTQFSGTPEGRFVAENAHRFGFIVRYPQNREDATGFVYEPWHIRFVGVEAATAIFNSGQILEEFLGH